MTSGHRGRVARTVGILVASAGVTAGLLGGMARPAEAAGAGTATAKEFKKVKDGQRLSKVRKIIHGRGAQVTGITEAPVFVWRSTAGKNAYVAFENGRVVDKARIDDITVSVAEYRKLKKGQRYRKVSKTIREQGSPVLDEREGGRRYQDFIWIDDTLTQVVWLGFVNGKLASKERLPVDLFLDEDDPEEPAVDARGAAPYVASAVRDQARRIDAALR